MTRTDVLVYGSAAALGVAVALGAGGALGYFGLETAVCVLIALVTLAPLAHRWWTGTFDLFEPATIVAAVYLVYFVFAPLARLATDDVSFLGRNFEGAYLKALVATLLAVTAMWAGYLLPVGPDPARGPSTRISPGRLQAGRRLGWLLLAGAVGCMVVWARLAGRSLITFLLPGIIRVSETGDGTNIAYLFLAIEWFIPALVLVMAAGGLRRPRTRIAAVLAVTVVYVSIGFRYRIALLWLAAGMITYLQSGRRPRLRYLLVPGVLAFLGAGWLSQARLYFWSGGTAGQLKFSLRSTVLAGLSDTRIFETFAAALGAIPGFIPFSGLDPFTYALLLPIPRFIWSGKPLPTSLQDVAASVGTPDAAGAGVFVPHFGEYYLAFGWPGIALGTFLFGAGIKWLWRWYRAAPDDPWRQALFTLNNAMLFLVVIRGYTPQMVMEWCFLVLPAVVLTAVARDPRRRAPVAPARPAVSPGVVPGVEAGQA